ncbi:MAG TPA: hypothetical protein VHZ32_09710 [Rhizomicrobium sp.]|nr:hypothetical protein [Rhizomicrobium sp.]
MALLTKGEWVKHLPTGWFMRVQRDQASAGLDGEFIWCEWLVDGYHVQRMPNAELQVLQAPYHLNGEHSAVLDAMAALVAFHATRPPQPAELSDKASSSNLRDALAAIVGNPRLDRHEGRILALKNQFPHTIECTPISQKSHSYNAVMHALDIRASDFTEPRSAHLQCPLDLVDFMIQGGFLAEAMPKPNGVIVYTEGETNARHVGRLVSRERVDSKWGSGNLYLHGLFEVPAIYGPVVSFFAPISREKALAGLDAWRDGLKAKSQATKPPLQ